MDISLPTVAVLCAAFCAAGFINAIAGGGGLITAPALLVCGVPPHFALGTGKMASTMGSLTAVWTFLRNDCVIRRIAPLGFALSALGSVAGAWAALQIDSALMGRIMILLLPVGFLVSLACGGLKLDEGPLPTRGLWAKTGLIAFAIGAYDGFFGPGAGSFFLIGIHVWLKAGLVQSSATARVFNLASNIGSFATFAGAGTIYPGLAVPLALASIAGNRLGARYAIKVGPRLVRGVLCAVLLALFLTLVHRYWIAA